MCQVCVAICRQIQEVFGHRVDPRKLEELIESSPLEPLEEDEVGNDNTK